MVDEDEIILADLDDDELVQQMHDDLYDGLQDEIVEGVQILLDRRWTPYDVLTKALVEGMTIVGIDFRDGILFVPEVLMAANAMKAGMYILRYLRFYLFLYSCLLSQRICQFIRDYKVPEQLILDSHSGVAKEDT